MNILVIGKFPPIQGGVSSSTLLFVKDLVKLNHSVTVLTNSYDVEEGYRQTLTNEDKSYYHNELLKGIDFYSLNQEQRFHHIPFSMAYSERLYGLGIKILSEKKIDLIFGWYFQPYGFVAYLLSKEFKIPFIINHAGSDLGRLSKNDDLYLSYMKILESSEQIISRRTSEKILLETFGDGLKSKIRTIRKGKKLPIYFSPKTKALELNKYIEEANKRYHLNYYKPFSEKIFKLNSKKITTDIPIIGMYGKCGETKGSWDIIEALKILKNKGVKFQFVYITGGSDRLLRDFYSFLIKNEDILDSIWILPFMPFWKIPSFIKSCDIVMFLEHNFPIKFHSPSLPYEILSMGKCLISSKEVIEKSILSNYLIDKTNYVEIENPNNIELLSDKITYAIEDEKYKLIGAHGLSISRFIQSSQEHIHPIANLINDREKTGANNVYKT